MKITNRSNVAYNSVMPDQADTPVRLASNSVETIIRTPEDIGETLHCGRRCPHICCCRCCCRCCCYR